MDLETPEEARRAIRELDGLKIWNSILKVSKSGDASGKSTLRRRLYVGGLPPFPDQQATEIELRDFFEGFELSFIGKLKGVQEEYTPRSLYVTFHHYCFVELVDEEQLEMAIDMLDMKEMWGSTLR